MRVLVCGGREYDDVDAVFRILDHYHAASQFTEVIHGNSRGADKAAGFWARERGVSETSCPADWKRQPDGSYDKAAGFKRNADMVAMNPDLVVAFPGNNGTNNTISLAHKAGIKVVQIISEKN